ncbi:hypothetical protein ZWY2020_007247 [Hordeum vulgare]|nr:hypothetical protein ZWY2020_007247 [Hordeum vulgare]
MAKMVGSGEPHAHGPSPPPQPMGHMPMVESRSYPQPVLLCSQSSSLAATIIRGRVDACHATPCPTDVGHAGEPEDPPAYEEVRSQAFAKEGGTVVAVHRDNFDARYPSPSSPEPCSGGYYLDMVADVELALLIGLGAASCTVAQLRRTPAASFAPQPDRMSSFIIMMS